MEDPPPKRSTSIFTWVKDIFVGTFCHPDFALIFKVRGSVMPRALTMSIPSALIAVGLHYVRGHTQGELAVESQGYSIWSSFSFVLGALIVFRTNQAYSRYWEGATLLMQVRGEWFNATSSLVAFCNSKPERRREVDCFQHQIVRLMSMLQCAGLQQVAEVSADKMEIIDNTGMDQEALEFLSRGVDRCEIVLQWIQRLIVQNAESGVVNIPPPVLSRVFQELSRGIVNAHNVRKIAEIPFPFPYTQMVLLMLLMHTLLTPVMASITFDKAWCAGLVTFMAVQTFWGMNFIAAEIEQPFGEDHNDLPIAEMLKDMNRSLIALLRPEAQNPPRYQMPGNFVVREKSCRAAGFLTRSAGASPKHVGRFARPEMSESDDSIQSDTVLSVDYEPTSPGLRTVFDSHFPVRSDSASLQVDVILEAQFESGGDPGLASACSLADSMMETMEEAHLEDVPNSESHGRVRIEDRVDRKPSRFRRVLEDSQASTTDGSPDLVERQVSSMSRSIRQDEGQMRQEAIQADERMDKADPSKGVMWDIGFES